MIKDLISRVWTKVKKWVILGVIVLLGLFGFKACRKIQQKQDKQASSTVLPPDAKEKIVVDPSKHEIEIIKPNGDIQKGYLPDRPTQIIEKKDGKLDIVDHKYGVEVRPYLGVGGSLDGTARIHAGTDLFYFHKLDLGTGLDFNAGVFKDISSFKDTRLSINVSYNFYSNTSLALSVDNRKFVGLFLKVHL